MTHISKLPTWLIIVAAIAFGAVLQSLFGPTGLSMVTGAAAVMLYPRWNDSPLWKKLAYIICISAFIGFAASFFCHLDSFMAGFAHGYNCGLSGK